MNMFDVRAALVYVVTSGAFPAQLLHRGGPFINSLLHLEELGFRSSSPTIKKIAFIAWKSLIDNFALNPGELDGSRRIQLLSFQAKFFSRECF